MMTKEVYVTQKKHLEGSIENLKELIAGLTAQYLNSSPWKVGDKVMVTDHKDQETVLYISSVVVDWKGEFEYRFSKPKKDGTMGGQSAGVYSPKKIVRHE